MMRCHATLGWAATLVASLVSSIALAQPAAPAAPAPPAGIAAPQQPTPTLDLDDLERGMKGYGMTVFEGDTPEPFAFEVVAVIRNSRPGRGVIWVRCTDPRLRFSGPVQGMSGSPMYVWSEGEEQEPGEGGRLIGAFAFGYPFSKECYIGVQPIEYMRQLAQREPADANARQPSPSTGGGGADAIRVLDALALTTPANSLSAKQLELARRVVAPARRGIDAEATVDAPTDDALHNTQTRSTRVSEVRWTRGPHEDRWVEALRLPIDVGSAEAARFAEPLLRPLGLRPVFSGAGGGMAAGAVKTNRDNGDGGDDGAGQAGGEGMPANPPGDAGPPLRPGSPLSVPLIMGDWDAAATGTVTDVLPDGTVLGFGHPMMGMGPSAMPMATGEVHFVMPRQDISFKQSSSRRVVGTLRRDAAAGVAGGPGVDFQTVDLRVAVDQVGVERVSYDYDIVDVPGSTAMFTAIAAMQSLTAVQGSPLDSTTRMRATMRFEDDRELTLDTLAPQASPGMLAGSLLMPMALMSTNAFEPTRLVSADVSFEVEPEVRLATIAEASLQKAVVAPGEAASVRVTLQPYGRPAVRRTLDVEVPPGTPEGNYMLVVGDAQTYLGMTLGNRPHLLDPSNVDELQRVLQRIVGVQSDALYLILQLPGAEVALGASELPQLPSSRAAILTTPTSSRASLYKRTVEATLDTPFATTGSRGFMLNVRDPAGEAKAGNEN